MMPHNRNPSVSSNDDIEPSLNSTSLSTQSLNYLQDLLQQNHQLDIIYENYLSNHIVHDLYSLHDLGASSERISDYYFNHSQKLQPLSFIDQTITHDNWRNYLGQPSQYPNYLKFFEKEINRYGFDQTFETYFPHLMSSSLGSTIHPLIHIGFALEFKNPIVLEEGLAYCCSWHLDIPLELYEYQNSNPSKSCYEIIRQIQQSSDFSEIKVNSAEFTPQHGSALRRLITLIKKPHALRKFLTSYRIDGSTIEENIKDLSELSVLLFAGIHPIMRLDFFILHGVTALHGIRYILPSLKPVHKIRLLRLYWLALACLYIMQGRYWISFEHIVGYRPWSFDINIPKEQLWKQIFARAVWTEDEHVPKLIRALYQMEKFFPEHDNRCLQVALRTLESIHSPDDWTYDGNGRAIPST